MLGVSLQPLILSATHTCSECHHQLNMHKLLRALYSLAPVANNYPPYIFVLSIYYDMLHKTVTKLQVNILAAKKLCAFTEDSAGLDLMTYQWPSFLSILSAVAAVVSGHIDYIPKYI